MIRSATSVAANYRAALRAKSRADFANKLAIVEEEADETQYCIEILTESGLVPAEQVSSIYNETDEILAMTVASIKTLRNSKS